MGYAAFAILLLMAACGSRPPQQPKAAAKSTRPSYSKIKAGDVLASPQNCGMIEYVRPVYPKEARKAHFQSLTRFRALITKTGEVTELEVLSGNRSLVPAATEAVKQWRYAPCRLEDVPIERRTTIDVNFTLNQ